MRTRTAPNEALDRLERLIQAHPPIALEDLNAVDDLRAFIADMTDEMPTPDADLVRAILADAEWENRPDWHGHRFDGNSKLADALGWECPSCRPDVGWVKWDTAIRDYDTEEVRIHVECGHCGSETFYDSDGNEVNE